MKQLLLSLAVLPFFMSCGESAPIKARVAATPKTFCNPVNIDYRFMKIDGGEGIREAADPVVVSYKDKYYFVCFQIIRILVFGRFYRLEACVYN